MKKIMVVDDEALLVKGIRFNLQNEGYEVVTGSNGLEAVQIAQGGGIDLIVLDVMLPGMDGIEILSKMKDSMEYSTIPVIMATAKGQEYDRIRGLDLGADDYIVKPFSMMEMVSRVKAVLRRSQPEKVSKLLKTGGLLVNLDEHTVQVDGTKVSLTYKEFELLSLFLNHPGMVYTREQLFA